MLIMVKRKKKKFKFRKRIFTRINSPSMGLLVGSRLLSKVIIIETRKLTLKY